MALERYQRRRARWKGRAFGGDGAFGTLTLALCFADANAQQRLTVPNQDVFIEDLKDSVREAGVSPSGKGTMVAVYGEQPFFRCFGRVNEAHRALLGLGSSSAIGPSLVGELAEAFIDATLKA